MSRRAAQRARNQKGGGWLFRAKPRVLRGRLSRGSYIVEVRRSIFNLDWNLVIRDRDSGRVAVSSQLYQYSEEDAVSTGIQWAAINRFAFLNGDEIIEGDDIPAFAQDVGVTLEEVAA